MQLLAARLIADDVLKIKETSQDLSEGEIIEKLTYNWTENIRNFTFALMELREEKECCQTFSFS
jgi:hypothetical protein